MKHRESYRSSRDTISSYESDNDGRPLHPWKELRDTLPDGKGAFYHWGPNYTVDPIVLTNDTAPSVLLIQRGDTGQLALPGGFIDKDEKAQDAASRELTEETRFTASIDDCTTVYTGPVSDHRSTRNAWPETTALLWQIENREPVYSGDDARAAMWVPLRDLFSSGSLHGSHAELIKIAVEMYGTPQQKLDFFGDEMELLSPNGGHMGYSRTIATLPTNERFFIKSHDASHFSDQEREAHSRLYLRKEQAIYESLSGRFTHMPQNVISHSDQALYMEAYDKRDGWFWRIPSDPMTADAYIKDILAALVDLESIGSVSFPELDPSYEAIINEGWPVVAEKIGRVTTLLSASDTPNATGLLSSLGKYIDHAKTYIRESDGFAHFDIRQSNIAWHPEHGTRIIDWSWADSGPKGLDTTSFLIDIAKSGHDIDKYQQLFHTDHAIMLMGFWLARATEPNNHGTNVREHQLASALVAYRLVKRYATAE